MSIEQLSKPREKDLLYDQGFRRLLEGYMPWFRAHDLTENVGIDPHHVYKYEGDLYGLLDALGIDKRYHWVVMRLNSIYRAGEVDQELRWLLIPDRSTIEKLKQLYQKRKKNTL